MSQLFSPFQIRGLTLKNRTVVAPMCQYSAVDGMATDYHLVHLGRFALGGFASVMVEATAVTPEGRISHGDMGLWSDGHIAPLARIADFLRENGAAPAIQLAHAGRKGSSKRPWRGGGTVTAADAEEFGDMPWQTVAPTAEAHSRSYAVPAELDLEGIRQVTEAFAASAGRALRAGFDIVELHCAHGYLLNEFLSPVANKRTDQYGGTRENRMRMPLEVVDAVRAVWPQDKPLFVRVSATDGIEGGWTIDDTVAFAVELKRRGVDVVDCSSSGFAGSVVHPGPHYQVGYAADLRKRSGIATMAVGLIFEPEAAEAVISRGDADLVALARGALFDPNWPAHVQVELDPEDTAYASWPLQSGYAVRARAKALAASKD